MLGARNVKTHRELTEEQLDEVAKRIGAGRPRSWNAVGDEEAIQKLMADIEKETKDFEGMVFRDKEGNRVKLKRDDYVKLHHLLGDLSFKKLIPKILEDEGSEIASYLPQAKKKIDEFNKLFNNYVDSVVLIILKYSNMNLDRKSLALKVFGGEVRDQYLRSLIMNNFHLKDNREIKDNVVNSLRELGENSPKRLMEVIGINEKDDEEDDVGEI